MSGREQRGPAPAAPRLDPVRRELSARDAVAVVAVGPADAPAIRYCLDAADESPVPSTGADTWAGDARAIAVTTDDVLISRADADAHPAERLATVLGDRAGSEPALVLTPPDVPHDAALYLEQAGLSLASTTVLDRARATKSAAERDRVEQAQAAAGAGVRRGAAALADATVADGVLAVDGDVPAVGGDGLAVDGEPLTADRLRREVDAAVVGAGGFPAGNTRVEGWIDGDGSAGERTGDEALRPGEPVVVSLAPRGPDCYHGGLVRTLVPESDGGWERRAHVALTQAFRSVEVMLSAAVRDADPAGLQDVGPAGDEPAGGGAQAAADESAAETGGTATGRERGLERVAAVEAELAAEARSFGFGEEVSATVHGVGLEVRERPSDPADELEPGTVVRVEGEIRATEGIVRLADLLALESGAVAGGDEASEEAGARWLSRPSLALDPAVVADGSNPE